MEQMTLHMENLIEFASGVCGNLYFVIGSECFPEEDWFDMIGVDLEQWIPNLVSFFGGHSDACRLSFMDGPCYAKLTREESGVFCAGYWNGKQTLIKREIDIISLLSSVIHGLDHYHQFTQIKYYSKEQKIMLQCIDLGDKHV